MAEIATALSDLAEAADPADPAQTHTSPSDAHPDRLDEDLRLLAAAATSNSVPDLSLRLAAIISGAPPPSPATPSSPIPPPGPSSPPAKPSPSPSPHALAKELALIHAFGIYAETVLSPAHRLRIAAPLVNAIATAIHTFCIAQHTPPSSPSPSTFLGAHLSTALTPPPPPPPEYPESHLPPSLHIWPIRASARRHVLRSALASRYGSASAAPTASVIAGPPLILFLKETPSSTTRISATFLPACTPSSGPSRTTSSLLEWRALTVGAAVFSVLNIPSLDALRATLADALKTAVKSHGLAPTLVVLDADPDTTLCSGVDVMRAVCDSYGARLHVEGPALALLAVRPAVVHRLEFDVTACVRAAHSVIVDTGMLFGVDNLCVVTWFAGGARAEEEDEGGGQAADEVSFARVMALWWLLQRFVLSLWKVTYFVDGQVSDIFHSFFLLRVRIHSVQQVIDVAAESGVEIVDRLACVPHLLTAKSVGASANVLFSYDGIEADAEFRKSVNRAILCRLASTSAIALAVGIQIAKFENREWILFSPLAVLRHGIGSGFHDSPSRGCSMSTDVIAAARRCEIAKSGASAFLTVAKQFEDIEVVAVPAGCQSRALYFGAVRVVPLGIASGNGYWTRDAEMTETVEKFTCALAARSSAEDTPFEVVLCDTGSKDSSAPFVFIGPLVGTLPTRAEGDVGEAPGGETDFRSVSPQAAHYSIDLARDLARRAGEYVGDTAADVITAITATPTEDEIVDNPTDGVLSSSLRDLHLESAEHTFDSANANGEDESGEGELNPRALNVVGSASEPAMAVGPRGNGDSKRSLDNLLLAKTRSSSIWERIFGVDGDETPSVEAEDDIGEEEVNFFRP